MNPDAMDPHGRALLAYFEGATEAELMIRRDDGHITPVPVARFFRELSSSIDKEAMERCHGHVLDAGAGTGIHSKFLQESGLQVTSIDISAQAVSIMQQQGLTDVHCADVFEYRGGPFDTLLMLGHGIGMVETIKGLDLFLRLAHDLISDDGRVLFDSLETGTSDEPSEREYATANRQAGRYIGEVRLQFEFEGRVGPYCGWLHVDSRTLQTHAESIGWGCEIACREGDDYLAQLTKSSQG